MEIKLKALRAHQSQFRGWDPESMVKKWAEEAAQGSDFKYAETFRVITLESDDDWQQYHGDVLKRMQ
jgi:hypothetical protein